MKHDKLKDQHQDNLHDVCGTRWDSPKGKTESKTKSTSGATKAHSSKSTVTTPKTKKSTTHKPTTGSTDKSNLYNTEEYVLVEEIVVIEEDF